MRSVRLANALAVLREPPKARPWRYATVAFLMSKASDFTITAQCIEERALVCVMQAGRLCRKIIRQLPFWFLASWLLLACRQCLSSGRLQRTGCSMAWIGRLVIYGQICLAFVLFCLFLVPFLSWLVSWALPRLLCRSCSFLNWTLRHCIDFVRLSSWTSSPFALRKHRFGDFLLWLCQLHTQWRWESVRVRRIPSDYGACRLGSRHDIVFECQAPWNVPFFSCHLLEMHIQPQTYGKILRQSWCQSWCHHAERETSSYCFDRFEFAFIAWVVLHGYLL